MCVTCFLTIVSLAEGRKEKVFCFVRFFSGVKRKKVIAHRYHDFMKKVLENSHVSEVISLSQFHKIPNYPVILHYTKHCVYSAARRSKPVSVTTS